MCAENAEVRHLKHLKAAIGKRRGVLTNMQKMNYIKRLSENGLITEHKENRKHRYRQGFLGFSHGNFLKLFYIQCQEILWSGEMFQSKLRHHT